MATARYTYRNSLVRKDGETPLFDGLGSERTVTNSSQGVTASLTLSAFGQAVASTGSSTSAYQFGATSGYRNDGDAGLALVGCRYYDAQVGRFLTRDTYLDQAPYAYCDGDPVNATDPSGHAPPKGKKPVQPPGLPYPKFYPPMIPITFGPPDVTVGGKLSGGPAEGHGDVKVSHETTVMIPGPPYWNSLSPVTQKNLDTVGKFCQYAQDHQSPNNYKK